MILPTSAEAGLLLLALIFICWGSWGVTQKATGKWPHEFYSWDFSLGVLVCMVVAAFTLGSMNSAELTFQDNFLIAGTRKMAYALGAGVLFNVAVILLISSTAVSGISVSFPVSLGIATVMGVIWNFSLHPTSGAIMPLGGAVLILAAIVLLAFAHSAHKDAMAESVKKSTLQIDPRGKTVRKIKAPTAALGIVLGIASGILAGFVPPILEAVREGDNGLAPYGTGVLFASGMLFSTVMSSPFVVNFPLTGNPVVVRDFLRSPARQHALGWLGGALWAAGALASFIVVSTPSGIAAGAVAVTAFSQSPAILAILLGMLAWREFKGSSERSRSLLWGVVVLYAAGIAMITLAPSFA